MHARLCLTCLLLAACARPSASPAERPDASAAVGGNGAADASVAADFAARLPLHDGSVVVPSPDLATKAVSDLAIADDLATSHVKDMTQPRDLTVIHDMTTLRDMTTLPDLTMPMPGDMTIDTCGHPLCTSWNHPLVDGCHWCVTKICAVDSYCCVNHWSSICVQEVTSICKLTCN